MKENLNRGNNIRVSADIGGTFTDIIIFDEQSCEIAMAPKISSNPKDLLAPVFEGLKIAKRQFPARNLKLVLHGSTVGLNTLLEKKGASVGLIATRGFRDVYEIARQWQGVRLFHLLEPKREMYLSRANICEVKERVNHAGEILEEIDEQEVREKVRILVDLGVKAIAVVFLFSFVNPTHERKVKELIQDRYPQIYVSLSSEVNPEWREYERTCTTIANAYIGPKVKDYMESFEKNLNDVYPQAMPLIMQSNGGVGTPTMLSKIPITTILSGPVAGVIGTKYLGDLIGSENLISFDVGGTSSDMSLLPGRILFQSETQLGLQVIRTNSVDVQTIGAGGGSIARVEYGSVIKVGPQSAGADPGPACYARGGGDPTLTDSLVVLGHLDANHLLKGAMAIDGTLARKVVRENIAAPLGISTEEAAWGILNVLVSNIIFSMRNITIERGYYPGDFSVVAFGGAGPTIANFVAKELGLKRVIVPPVPGNFCAFGMNAADIYKDNCVTRINLLDETSSDEIEAALSDIEHKTVEELKQAGMKTEGRVIQRFMDLRYSNQAYEIAVPVATFTSRKDREHLEQLFHEYHTKRYGFSAEDAPIEIINYRVRVIVPIPKLVLKSLNKRGDNASLPDARITERQAVFDASCALRLTPVYDRELLFPGHRIQGPAVIEEYSSTTVIFPGQEAHVDDYRNIHIYERI